MDGNHQQRSRVSLLSEPLPEVVESDSEASWLMFLDVQAGREEVREQSAPSPAPVDLYEVLREARRVNRAAPLPPQWESLGGLLQELAGAAPPPPLGGVQFAASSAMEKRIRVREQIEWADERGHLAQVMAYLKSLSEDEWHHIGD